MTKALRPVSKGVEMVVGCSALRVMRLSTRFDVGHQLELTESRLLQIAHVERGDTLGLEGAAAAHQRTARRPPGGGPSARYVSACVG
jgi:phage tail tape-measure protein